MAKGLPSTVMIIRHGEKLGDPVSDDDGGKHLSLQGSARAAALPTLFLPSWVAAAKPAAFACSDTAAERADPRMQVRRRQNHLQRHL
ncbi:MAG: hypothetical protein WDO17_15075 [Alphaproteobacteria bacterium]